MTCGIATCLNRAIGMAGLSPAGLRPCRPLPRTVRDSLPSYGSCHLATALMQQRGPTLWLLPLLVDQRYDQMTQPLRSIPITGTSPLSGRRRRPVGAGLRPPLKPSVQFSRTGLSQGFPNGQMQVEGISAIRLTRPISPYRLGFRQFLPACITPALVPV